MTAEAAAKGKKIGRPKGAKSAPPGLRAARWVRRHLGDEAAVPPSPLAARLLALAREEADRFALFLDQAEMQARPWGGVGGPAQGASSRRVRKLVLSGRQAMDFWQGTRLSWMQALPPDLRVIEWRMTRPGHGGGWVLTIESPTLSPVPEGQPVPEWQAGNCFGWQ